MPTANTDSTSTPQATPVTIAVLANDDGAGLSITGYTEPGAGGLVLNPDGSFTYTPVAGFSGSDGFTYTVRDAAGATATAMVTVTVARPNTAPRAEADMAQVTAGESVVLPVLANDVDPEDDQLTLLLVEAPGHGTVQVEPGGDRLRYTPQAGFVGTDSFTYTVADGQGGLATGSVTVAVTTGSTPPAPVPDRVVTGIGEAVTVDVLANDQDPEGEPLTLTGVTLPAHGTLSLTAEQRFVYTPEPGFEGEDGFTYTVKDATGLRATGTVALLVERRNTAPVATPDSAVSVGGVPVRLDLLANDNDPEGDPLRLTALELPAGGQLTVNPDQSVTYTPKTGFSGTDRFTYTVGDGAAEATVEATVEVLPAAGVTFANGYRYRRRLVLPAGAQPAGGGAGSAAVQDVVLLVKESGDWLRGVAGGGRVESGAGFDLRFELQDGTKLDHELERYDSAAGELVAWVRLPSWRQGEMRELMLYYGKPGLAASEAAPAGTWRGYLAVWDPRTGADRTGRGRALVPTGVTVGDLVGACGRYDGNAVARRTDVGFLAGLDALTVQAVVQADAAMRGSGHGILAQGPMSGDPAAVGLGLSYLARSAAGAERVVAFGLRCADGELQAVSAGDAQGEEPQVLHATWARGTAPLVYVDGAPGPAGGPVRSGATAPPAGAFHLGAGPGDPATGGWRGLIDEVRLRAAALPAAWIALEAVNLLLPAASYGLGGEDAAVDALAAPVALPVAVRATAGDHVDLDPLASVQAPDGHGLALVAFDQPAGGRATVVDGRIRYSPRAGFLGRDRFAYTVSGGGKRSTGLITVEVAAPTTQAVDEAVSTAVDQPVSIDVLANDLGQGLSLAGVEAPAHGTAAISGSSIVYRPDPGFTGSDSFAYRIASALGESRATVAVTVTDDDPNLPYAYVHKPAAELLPASDADIVVWNVPAAGGTCPHVGNADQVLLMVAPTGPVRGAVSATNLQFKAVFLIGATLRPQGITSLSTANGTWVRGGDVLRIGFAAGIAVRPVLFLANLDYDARNATEPNLFGGFLQAGTSRPAAGPADPDGSANAARWVDVYLQKIRVSHGSYSFAATGSAASAFFQPRTGGVGDLRCGQLDLRWHGPAFHMAGFPAPRDTVRPDARLFLNRVALRAMPPAPATADPLPAPALFHLAGGAAEGAVLQLERGNCQAVLFDGVQLERYPADGGELEAYFVPAAAPDGGGLRFDSVRQRIGFPAYRASGRLHQAWTGEVAVAAAAPAMVTEAEVGASLRVTTPLKLREILLPRPELRAADDEAATTRGAAVTIDLLANDTGADGARVTLGDPGQGTVSLTADNRARYTPAAGFTGADSFTYTVTRGERSSTATVRVEVSGQTVGAWGIGPRSGDRWWSGFGDVTAGSLGMVAAFERMRGRPVDIIATWAPKNQIQSWDDIAGGPGDDESRITGTLTQGVNNKRVIWDNAATRALPVHLNLTLVPPSASNRNGANPGVWWDYAAGQFDVYWRRLGRRMAFLDDLVDRTAPLVLDLGWEHSGPWYHWSIAGSRGGTPAFTQFPYAFARIVAAVREGYYGYDRKNCPYRFCWRPSRQTVAAGVHHSAFYPGDEAVDLIGMSHHERDPYLTPTNWSSRTSTWPAGRSAFTREGWDPFFDFCANRGKQACLPEWGPIEHHPEYEPSSYPEEFFRLTRSYIEARLPLFAYDCYFNGDEAKLTAHADWGGTREYRSLWGRAQG